MDRKKVIAIDFDGTLFENAFPDIGPPRNEVIEWAIKAKQRGNLIVLWTCRDGDTLQKAIEACASCGLVFDAVNDMPIEWFEPKGNPKYRKMFADVYVDDRAMTPEDAIKNYEI